MGSIVTEVVACMTGVGTLLARMPMKKPFESDKVLLTFLQIWLRLMKQCTKVLETAEDYHKWALGCYTLGAIFVCHSCLLSANCESFGTFNSPSGNVLAVRL